MFRKHTGLEPPPTPMGSGCGVSYHHWGTLLLSWKMPSIVRECHVTWDTGFPTLALNSAMHSAEAQQLVLVRMRMVEERLSDVRRGGH